MTSRELQPQRVAIFYSRMLLLMCLHGNSIRSTLLFYCLVYGSSACFGFLFLSKSNSKRFNVAAAATVFVCSHKQSGQRCAGVCVDLFISFKVLYAANIQCECGPNNIQHSCMRMGRECVQTHLNVVVNCMMMFFFLSSFCRCFTHSDFSFDIGCHLKRLTLKWTQCYRDSIELHSFGSFYFQLNRYIGANFEQFSIFSENTILADFFFGLCCVLIKIHDFIDVSRWSFELSLWQRNCMFCNLCAARSHIDFSQELNHTDGYLQSLC